eukprot:TRINITY_DN14405_c0_g1_i1.p1 TRINITY_DN14405_c0_g1~~TRINITY_DN14405_c0_g1_i1.p1  ORF type:complete len:253 (+),score=26.74 TRINITY_DN14405_c0_g1_i1:24-761(+)
MDRKRRKITAKKDKTKEPLAGLVIAVGRTVARSIKTKITSSGGKATSSITDETTHYVTTQEEVDKQLSNVKKAYSKKVPIVSEKFVLDAIDDGTVQDTDDYILEMKDVNDDEEDKDTMDAKSTRKRKRAAKDSLLPAKPSTEPEKESEKDSKKESKSAPMASNEEKESTVGKNSIKSNEGDKRDVEVVFSFDTTGSMYPCLTQVRREIQTCTERLFNDIPSIRIGILAHGDSVTRGKLTSQNTLI